MTVGSSSRSGGVVCLCVLVPLSMMSSQCKAFVLPTGKAATSAKLGSLAPAMVLNRQVAVESITAPLDKGGMSTSSSVLGMDLSAQVPDGVRFVVIGLVVVIVIVYAISLFVTQSVLPEQMEKLALVVEQDNPERFATIKSKLGEGEIFADRPDLMAELAEAGVTVMMNETDEEMKYLISMVNEKKAGNGDMETLREPIEAAIGTTVEDFIAKVDKNSDSRYLTESGKELATVLKKELLNRKDGLKNEADQ